jgi:UrcA family protein
MKTYTSRVAAMLAAASFIGIAGFVGATPAQARANGSENRVAVKYGDLNLGSNGGADRLYARLHFAAERVCNDNDPDAVFLQIRREIRGCEEDAMARAIAKVDSPKLTADFTRQFPQKTFRISTLPGAGATSAG